jgi:hypothetical protein
VRASRERGTPTTEREGPTCSIRGVSWTIGRLRKKRRHGSRNCEEVAPPSLYRIRFSLFWLVTSMHNAPTQAARGSMGKASCCPPPHLTFRHGDRSSASSEGDNLLCFSDTRRQANHLFTVSRPLHAPERGESAVILSDPRGAG